MLTEVNQYEGIDGHYIDHQILGTNKHRQVKAVKLAQFFGIYMVTDNYDMQMVREVSKIKSTITKSKIHHEAFTPGPPEESLVALVTK